MLADLNRRAIDYLDRTIYGDYPDNWDNDMFRSQVLEYAKPSDRLLDIGAGRGALPQMDFSNDVATVIGVDPDPVVETNPYLDQAVVSVSEDLTALDDSSFDIVVCNNVLEHVPDAPGTFAEVQRVLRPGGVFITKTPNLYHYMATIARVTPTSFHRFATKLRGRPFEDTFPTLYQANSRKRQEELAAEAGLVVASLDLVEGRPEYLRFSAPTYAAGLAYEQLVNRLNLENFKIVIFTVFEKPSFLASGGALRAPSEDSLRIA